jgi:arylsulfatase A-like enzyme
MDFEARPRHAYGFDVFWPSEERGNYSDAYYHWLEGKHPELAARFRVPRSSDPDRHFAEKTPQPVDAPWQASQAGWIVDAADQFLRSRRDQDWFVHLGFYNPHPPLTPVQAAWDAYADRDLAEPAFQQKDAADANPALAATLRQRADWTPDDFRNYRKGLAAMVTEMDFAIGALLEGLEARGELENTLLVFSSDHGDMAGDHNLTHKGNHFYEACLRVPLILHWPAGLGTDRRDCQGLMEMVDLLPTLIELSGGQPHPAMAGQSVAGDLLAGREPEGRPDVYAYSGEPRAMLRTAVHKYGWFGPEREVLYDLVADPCETRNAAGDPEQSETLAALRARCLERSLAASRSPQRKLYPY